MIVIGLMSGTSADAVDVAAADVRLPDESIRVRTLGATTHPFPAAVRDLLDSVLSGHSLTAAQLCRLDSELGQTFANAGAAGIDALSTDRPDLVVSHGQTVHHWVEDGAVRGTLQLGNPAWIAERTGLPVISDLRVRDVAAGGQGAPLVSLVDALLLGGSEQPEAALNLGGIANLTVVTPNTDPVAFDVGPANALLDAAVRRHRDGAGWDEGGTLAARGQVNDVLLDVLLDDPYYRRSPPKTTGKERFNRPYLDEALARAPVGELEDVLATLTAAAARVIADALRPFAVGRVTASGGGVRNATLMRILAAELAPADVVTSDVWGLPPDSKEAYAFAVLGFLSWNGIAGTLPSCTGARGSRILGSLTPGRGPLTVPAPAGGRPRRLVIEGPG
ncbi:MAG: anhydro-N-acetylmuramic acid kinase [Actinomycetota bacterium]|nr:anhydro-N-acetylmuramic acid kinase [Actinomycetota bacterium]